jgi:transcriptional regulator with XRE-family HTH domain
VKRETGNPIDRVVGQRVRLLRLQRQMSQTDLAEQLGLTFQQLQKYEKGTNRISASKLHMIAKVLNVKVAALFADTEDPSQADDVRTASTIDMALLTKIARIPDGKIKRGILELVTALSDTGAATRKE